MKLTRTVTREECPWLDADLPEGTTVYNYTGCTYGCISWQGKAVSIEENGPFLEVPRSALSQNRGTE